ncbi:MAG: 50S ribosomal protein L9 [Patescibacteria group bacterium]
MKIVLLGDVRGVGKKFEVKNVTGGYARNHLLPSGLALVADRAARQRVELLKQQDENRRGKLRTKAVELIGQLNTGKTVITIEAKANEQGHLFEGIDRLAIIEAIKKETKIELEPDWLELIRPIKAVGDYDLKISSGGGEGIIKIKITPEEEKTK